jgi:hypothetical protein
MVRVTTPSSIGWRIELGTGRGSCPSSLTHPTYGAMLPLLERTVLMEQQIQFVTAQARKRVSPALIPVLAVVALVALAACGGGDDGAEEATALTPTPADEPPTQAPTVELPTPTAEGDGPADEASPTVSIDWCDLVTAEEADAALGEFVSGIPGGNLNCQWQTDSGIYLRIEPGSRRDFSAGAELQGVGGEPVAGIGEEAVWFSGVQFSSHHWDFDEMVALGVLSLRQGDVDFRIMLNLPEVDSSTQLETAKDLADKALARIP